MALQGGGIEIGHTIPQDANRITRTCPKLKNSGHSLQTWTEMMPALLLHPLCDLSGLLVLHACSSRNHVTSGSDNE